MKRLTYRLCVLVLLSGTCVLAASGNLTAGSKGNPIKDATKTSVLCNCGSGVVVDCHSPQGCVGCCAFD